MSYADGIAEYVGIVLDATGGTVVYRGQTPDKDGVTYSLVPGPGKAPANVGDDYDFLSYNLIVRSMDIRSAATAAGKAGGLLQCNRHITRGGVGIVSITTHPPTYRRYAEKGIHEYIITMNITVTRTII